MTPISEQHTDLLYPCRHGDETLNMAWILYNQRDATHTMSFIIISALHVSGGFSAHHQEPIKLYVQPWVLSCESMTIPKAAHTVL